MYLPITDSRVQFFCDTKIRIFIANYLALGFLGGKEVQAAKIGNLGIGDRRHLA
jgi:hypothetical protein